MCAARESQRVLPLISSELGTTSFRASVKPRDSEFMSGICTPFQITCLPPELRNEIYAYHFAFLPALNITPSNVSSPLHREVPLSLSSPFFKSDILLPTFYQNCTFSFSSPKVLRQFAKGPCRERVAKVRIEYGKLSRCHHTDWIFLLFRYFQRLCEVTFVLDTAGRLVEDDLFGQWWKCVRGATREAANSQQKSTGKKSTRVLLKVECGEWNVRETVGERER